MLRVLLRALAAVLFAPALPAASPASTHPPNIVIIFTDDMGYGDIGVQGAKGFTTPHLDRMAREGTRFTRFYVAQAVCSASRAALLTGCYPNRIGIRGALGPGSPIGLNAEEMTLAGLVKQRAYATAIFGKWHLGDAPPFLPTRHGFDEYFGLPYSNDMWPLHPDLVKLPPDAPERKRRYPELPLFDGEKIVNAAVTGDDQAQLTTWYTERAVRFIERNRSRPFLLYLAHTMPHVPLFVSDKFKGKSGHGLYGDVIMELDWSTGQILETLRRLGLDERTLVIFISDNGPWLSYGNHAGSAGPLREGKGTSWDGGVRVPCLMRWPGRIPANRVCHEPAMTIDLFPTIARLIGAELPAHPIDGRDIWPLIAGEPGAKNPHDAYALYYANNELQSVLAGRWKLVFPHGYRTLEGRPGGRDGLPVPYSQRRIARAELYDMENDIGETTDLAAQHPGVVTRLNQVAERFRDDLGDSLTQRKGRGVRPPGRVTEPTLPAPGAE